MVRATNWIGDAVISLPALEALRARIPKAEIVLVAKPWVSEVYWYHPAISHQIVYDRQGRHRGASGFRDFIRTLRAEQFDAAILLPNAFHAAWMAWRAKIPARIGYARDGRSALLTDAIEPPPRAAYDHEAFYYLQLLFRAGLIERPEPARPFEDVRLTLRDGEKAWAARHLRTLGLDGRRSFVGIHPGASFGPAKRWMPERFAALADHLMGSLDAEVLIFGAPDERPLAETIALAMKRQPKIVAGATSLRQLMALLAQCRVVVTNDSGPMHLAAALGVPLVAIFGSTDEHATGPLSLAPYGAGFSARARVVKRPVACSPCGLRECPIDFRCMKGVTVRDVAQAVEEVLHELEVSHDPSTSSGSW